MNAQLFVVALTFFLILALAMALEWALGRQVARILAAVERDGFYTSKRVEVIMQGDPNVFAVRYSHRVGQGRRRSTVVRGVDALRRELELGLG